ncbi:hypothetical protein [Caulobacter sp. UC70_42]
MTAPTAATVGHRFRSRRLRLGRFVVAVVLAVLSWAVIILVWCALSAWLA